MWGGVANFPYWSSTEGIANGALYQYFTNGSNLNYYKANELAVRAVRAFDLNCIAPQVLKNNICFTPNLTPDIVCNSPQLRNPATNTCYTPDVTCTAPQVRNAQNNTCYTPDVICNSPQVRDPGTNVCVTPTSSGTYTLGSKGPAGGIVFYVYNAGKNGLEAQAANYVYDTPLTATIFTATEVTTLVWQDAVKAASSYGPGWHLPTKDELNQLYLQRSVVGGFNESSYYWSSTENGSRGAWLQNFRRGEQVDYPVKYDPFPVRAVRAF